MANVVGIAAEQLQQIVMRIERLEEEKKGIADDIKEVYAEAKSNGFDVKIVRNMIRLRKLDRATLQEMDALMELYRDALDMTPDSSAGDASGHNETAALIGAVAAMVPKSGSIILNSSEGGIRLRRNSGGRIEAEFVTPKPSRPSGNAGSPDGDREDGEPDADAAKQAPPDEKPKKKGESAIPDVDDDGAEELGRQYARGGRPVLDNPFPFRDPRQPRFDKGWRSEAGSDGMGPKT